MADVKRFRPGDARGMNLREQLNALLASVQRAGTIKVTDGLQAEQAPHGTTIGVVPDNGFYAQLSGTASPYSYTEVAASSGGGFTALTGGRTGTSMAYEVNAVASLGGKYAWLIEDPTTPGAYRFQYVKMGTGTSTLNVTVKGCNGQVFGSGITVTLLQGLTTIGSTTTNISGIATFTHLATGNYNVQVNGVSRFQNFSGSTTVASGTNNYTAQLTIASGYVCLWSASNCVYPIPTTMHISGSIPGHGTVTNTVTYNSSIGGFATSFTFASAVSLLTGCGVAGCLPTANQTITYYVYLGVAGSTLTGLNVTTLICASGTTCPSSNVTDAGGNAPAWPTWNDGVHSTPQCNATPVSPCPPSTAMTCSPSMVGSPTFTVSE